MEQVGVEGDRKQETQRDSSDNAFAAQSLQKQQVVIFHLIFF